MKLKKKSLTIYRVHRAEMYDCEGVCVSVRVLDREEKRKVTGRDQGGNSPYLI